MSVLWTFLRRDPQLRGVDVLSGSGNNTLLQLGETNGCIGNEDFKCQFWHPPFAQFLSLLLKIPNFAFIAAICRRSLA